MKIVVYERVVYPHSSHTVLNQLAEVTLMKDAWTDQVASLVSMVLGSNETLLKVEGWMGRNWIWETSLRTGTVEKE